MRSLIILLGLCLNTPSIADDFQTEPYDQYGNPNYRYEGPTGKRYQYDLNNPSDQIQYEIDVGAQLRDEINPDPRIQIDQDLGQFGGGAEY